MLDKAQEKGSAMNHFEMDHFGIPQVEAIAKQYDVPWRFAAVNREDGGKAVYIIPKEIPLNNRITLTPAFKRRMLTGALCLAVLLPLFLMGIINFMTMLLLFSSLGALSVISGVISIPYISDFFHGSSKGTPNKIRAIDYPIIQYNLTKFGEDKFISTNTYHTLNGGGLSGAVANLRKDYHNYPGLFANDYNVLKNGSNIVVDKDAFKKYKDAIEAANNAIAAENPKNDNFFKRFPSILINTGGKNKRIEASAAPSKNPFLDVYPMPVGEIQ